MLVEWLNAFRRVCIGSLGATAAACGSLALDVPATNATPVTLTLHALTLDGSVPPDLHATISAPSGSSLVSFNSAGVATLAGRSADSLAVRVESNASSRFYASQGQIVLHRDTSVAVVLLPHTWTVQRGTYASTDRTIDLAAALEANDDGSRYLDGFAPSVEQVAAWTDASFPIPVGFDSSAAGRRWTAHDSTVFWQYADTMNAIAGRTLFKPSGDQTITSAGAIGLTVDYTFMTSPQGWLAVRTLNSCVLPVRFCGDVHGEVAASAGFYGQWSPDEKIIMHELMHALGFGHSCHWPSIMGLSRPQCVAEFPKKPTADDIAYLELMTRLATVLSTHPEAWQLREALAALSR